MKSTIFWWILLAFVLAAASVFAAGCSDDDDNDSDGPTEVEGWDGGTGCGNGWTYTGEMAGPGEVVTTDLDDCIPSPLPDEDYRETLETLLTAYLGDYEDQDGNPREILCRPDGMWILPGEVPDGAACVESWYLPVWVRYNEEEEPVIGGITHDAGDGELPTPLTLGGDLSFETADGTGYTYIRQDDPFRFVVDIPRDIQFEIVWTKVE